MSDDLARDETPWLIWKASREGFYRPDRRGYTGRIEDAGRYTREEAEAECHIEPWNIYAIPAREPPRSFHPPQEHTWTGLKKVRDFIETKFPTTIEGTLHDDAETMLNECDAVLASSPQGTVRDPGAATLTEALTELRKIPWEHEPTLEDMREMRGESTGAALPEDDQHRLEDLRRAAKTYGYNERGGRQTNVAFLLRLLDGRAQSSLSSDVAGLLRDALAEVARLTQQLAEADAVIAAPDAPILERWLDDPQHQRWAREACERHALRTKRSTTTP